MHKLCSGFFLAAALMGCGNEPAGGGAGRSPSAGAANGGSAGSVGPSSGGAATSGGSAGSAGAATAGGASGSPGGGNGGSSGSDSGGAPGCASNCGTHKWACWPMPNPATSGLPNPASYTDMGDVIHDNLTCLDWQRSPPDAQYTNQAAIDYCEGLSLGGFDDWRLPTRVELASIVDFTQGPTIDPVFDGQSGFHKTGSNWVLTIDQTGAGAGNDFAWAYNLGDGIVSNAYSAANEARARCVRGNGTGEAFSELAVAPPNQYTEISAGEVQDNYTGLIWERDGEASGLVDWQGAASYCDSLTLGGQDNWRLPSVRELATLVDEAEVAPAINRAMFPNTHYGARSDNWYWASHTARNNDSAHWALNFDDGFTGFNAGAQGAWNYWNLSYAKCVR